MMNMPFRAFAVLPALLLSMASMSLKAQCPAVGDSVEVRWVQDSVICNGTSVVFRYHLDVVNGTNAPIGLDSIVLPNLMNGQLPIYQSHVTGQGTYTPSKQRWILPAGYTLPPMSSWGIFNRFFFEVPGSLANDSCIVSNLADTSAANPLVLWQRIAGCPPTPMHIVNNMGSNWCRPSFQAAVQAICGSSHGSIVLSSIAGGIPFTYSWSTGDQTSSISAPTPGEYRVTVTDTLGCTSLDTFEIILAGIPTADAGIDTGACAGDTFTIGGAPSGTGGVGMLRYQWSPGSFINDDTLANPKVYPTHLTTYQLVVTDSNGCTDTAFVQIAPFQIEAFAGSDKTIICAGDTVRLGGNPTVTGGTPPIQFSWTNGATLSDASVANPLAFPSMQTKYILTAEDSSACTATDSVVVNVSNLAVDADAGADDTICRGESLLLGGAAVASGGLPPYTYHWSPAASLNDSTLAKPLATPDTLTRYFVLVLDSAGCRGRDSIDVLVGGQAKLQFTTTIRICEGDSVDLGGMPTAQGDHGAFKYVWTPADSLTNDTIANPKAFPADTTVYVLRVTDTLGCEVVDSIRIYVLEKPTVGMTPFTDTFICSNGAKQFTRGCPVGGIFSGVGVTHISDTIHFDTLLATGLIPDSGFGSFITQFLIDSIFSSGTDTLGRKARLDSICFEIHHPDISELHLEVTTPAGAKLVLLDSLDAIQCDVDTLRICVAREQIQTPTLQCDQANNILTGTYAAYGGIDLDTLNDDSTLASGTWQLRITDQGGGNTGEILGWSMHFAGTSGVLDPSQINPPGPAWIYYDYTAPNGCAARDSQTIIVIGPPVVDPGPTIYTCPGFNVQLGGNPTGTSPFPISYQWEPSGGLFPSDTVANPTVTVSSSTSFVVVVTDRVYGCSDTAAQLVSIPVLDAGPDQVICLGDSVIIGGSPTMYDGKGPYNYLWQPAATLDDDTLANPTAKPTVTTKYVVSGTDATGCDLKDSMVVMVSPPIIVDAGDDTTICIGNTLTLGGAPTASGGVGALTYVWQPVQGINDSSLANPLAGPLVTTSYSVTVTDTAGCQATGEVIVTVTTNVPTANAGPDQTICEGEVASLGGAPTASGGTPPYTYSWKPAGLVDDPSAANTTGAPVLFQVFTVTVTDANNCVVSDAATVLVNAAPIAVAGNDTSVCVGDTVLLGSGTTCTPPCIYEWLPQTGILNPGAQEAVLIVQEAGSYTLRVTDANGCKDENFVFINIECDRRIGVPTIFTPNGDGHNDDVRVIAKNLREYYFRIFNRYGQVLFESTMLEDRWDGTYKGEPQPAGTYTYLITGSYADDTPIKEAGDITLIR